MAGRSKHGRSGAENPTTGTRRVRYQAIAPDGNRIVKGTIYVTGPTALIAIRWVAGRGWVALGVHALDDAPTTWASGMPGFRHLLRATRVEG